MASDWFDTAERADAAQHAIVVMAFYIREVMRAVEAAHAVREKEAA